MNEETEYCETWFLNKCERVKKLEKVDEAWFIKYNILKDKLEREIQTQKALRKNAYEIRDGFIKANQCLNEKIENINKILNDYFTPIEAKDYDHNKHDSFLVLQRLHEAAK
jgi:hypothetical protein